MKHKSEITKIAGDILSQKLALIEGARKLADFQHELELAEDKDVLFFVYLSSETDHLPSGEVRNKWAPQALKTKDDEIADVERKYGEDAKIACNNLIKKFSNLF